MKTFITAQILSYLRNNPNGTHAAIADKCKLKHSSVQAAMRALLDAGMVIGDVRKIENSRGNTKDWRITPKGRAADKQNPLNSGSKRHGISIKSQATAERLSRMREVDAQAAEARRNASVEATNPGVEVEHLKPTRAGDRISDAPAFFAAMPPGVYVLPPASCAARAV